MLPITVHNAPAGKPFTVTVDGTTVLDLFRALSILVDMGYGGTSLLTQDWNDEINRFHELRLFDTADEQTQGITLEATTFFLI